MPPRIATETATPGKIQAAGILINNRIIFAPVPDVPSHQKEEEKEKTESRLNIPGLDEAIRKARAKAQVWLEKDLYVEGDERYQLASDGIDNIPGIETNNRPEQHIHDLKGNVLPWSRLLRRPQVKSHETFRRGSPHRHEKPPVSGTSQEDHQYHIYMGGSSNTKMESVLRGSRKRAKFFRLERQNKRNEPEENRTGYTEETGTPLDPEDMIE